MHRGHGFSWSPSCARSPTGVDAPSSRNHVLGHDVRCEGLAEQITTHPQNCDVVPRMTTEIRAGKARCLDSCWQFAIRRRLRSRACECSCSSCPHVCPKDTWRLQRSIPHPASRGLAHTIPTHRDCQTFVPGSRFCGHSCKRRDHPCKGCLHRRERWPGSQFCSHPCQDRCHRCEARLHLREPRPGSRFCGHSCTGQGHPYGNQLHGRERQSGSLGSSVRSLLQARSLLQGLPESRCEQANSLVARCATDRSRPEQGAGPPLRGCPVGSLHSASPRERPHVGVSRQQTTRDAHWH
jgi:hypothetical protein